MSEAPTGGPLTKPPLIIWTMRRSGGTSLSTELTKLYDRKTADEPFNIDRKFGGVTRRFMENGDRALLRAGVREALSSIDIIKHCIDFLPIELHEAILAETAAQGWRHLVLSRRQVIKRVLSLEFSRQTGIWGTKDKTDKARQRQFQSGEVPVPAFDIDRILNDYSTHHARETWLRQSFRRADITPHRVVFEDAYGRFPVAEWLPPLMDYLQVPEVERAAFLAAMQSRVKSGGQKTQSLYDRVPNIEEARAALEAAKARQFPAKAQQS